MQLGYPIEKPFNTGLVEDSYCGYVSKLKESEKLLMIPIFRASSVSHHDATLSGFLPYSDRTHTDYYHHSCVDPSAVMWYTKDSENQAPIKEAAELLTNKKLSRGLEQRYCAEHFYNNARYVQLAPEEEAPGDKKLKLLRGILDDLRKKQRTCRRDDFDYYDEFMVRMYQMYPRVIYAHREWEVMYDCGAEDVKSASQMFARFQDTRTWLDGLDSLSYVDGGVSPMRLPIHEHEPIEEYTEEDPPSSLPPAASSSSQTGHRVEVCELGSSNGPTTDDLGTSLPTGSMSSPTATSKTISRSGSFVPARTSTMTTSPPNTTTQTLEARVLSLEQQMHDLQISENKEVMEDAEMKKEKKRNASMANGDDADALELRITQHNFDDAKSKLQDAQREVQEALYVAEVAKIKLEAAELDNIHAAAKLELSKRLVTVASQRG
ncbi:hypothetical protein KCU81_g9297, partial [Aureobasidium melanogenum]|uniref:Uncharacterized protein n=1 Tax=Aureobasidium melanogenum (strain CBS 110374) TaxID=1043003 RepID=A0A074VBE1_AURM1